MKKCLIISGGEFSGFENLAKTSGKVEEYKPGEGGAGEAIRGQENSKTPKNEEFGLLKASIKISENNSLETGTKISGNDSPEAGTKISENNSSEAGVDKVLSDATKEHENLKTLKVKEFQGNSVEYAVYDLIIAADRGADYARRLNIVPNIVIGDFDSCEAGSGAGDFDSCEAGRELIPSICRPALHPDFSSSSVAADSLRFPHKPKNKNDLEETSEKNSFRPAARRDESGIRDSGLCESESGIKNSNSCDNYPGIRNPDLCDNDLGIRNPDSCDNYPGIPEIIRLPREKNFSDTFYAVKYALGKGCFRIDIICIMGGRFDHMLSNLQTAAYAASRGARCRLIGEHDIIHVFCGSDDARGQITITRHDGWSVSAFALSEKCEGVKISGSVYDKGALGLPDVYDKEVLGVFNEDDKGALGAPEDDSRVYTSLEVELSTKAFEAGELTLRSLLPQGLSNEFASGSSEITYSLRRGILAVVESRM